MSPENASAGSTMKNTREPEEFGSSDPHFSPKRNAQGDDPPQIGACSE